MDKTDREALTVCCMIEIYCKGNHGHKKDLCPDCQKMLSYAMDRINNCKRKGQPKSTCFNCTIHCYEDEMREYIRKVMRYAGPRMLIYHPILTLFHALDNII